MELYQYWINIETHHKGTWSEQTTVVVRSNRSSLPVVAVFSVPYGATEEVQLKAAQALIEDLKADRIIL